MAKRDPRLRLFIRLDANLQPIAGSSVLRKKKPSFGTWVDITDAANLCCTTTTTTSTSTTTTTTTTP